MKDKIKAALDAASRELMKSHELASAMDDVYYGGGTAFLKFMDDGTVKGHIILAVPNSKGV